MRRAKPGRKEGGLPKPRTYPRVVHEGTEYLLLIEQDTLSQLNLEWAFTAADIKDFYKKYKLYTETAKQWFYIETGIELILIPREQGFAWAVEDERDMSTKYVWLRRKALRFERKIVERLNSYGDSINEALGRIGEGLEEDKDDNTD